MTTNNLLFVSYSRAQFYFAKSLVLALQDADLDVWFDVQRLTPGSDWQAGIESGLASCTALLLVASRAALASSYVRQEWEAALAAEKPVYVVLFEAVNLPPELQAAGTIVDMRHDFDAGLRRLLGCVQLGECRQDHVPRPNWLHLPFTLAREVLTVAGLLLVYSILLLLWGAVTAMSLWEQTPSWTMVLLLLAPAGLLLHLWLRWLYRRVGYRTIRLTLFGGAFGPFVLIIPLALLSLTVFRNTNALVVGLIFSLLFLAPRPLAVRILNAPSTALLRWMPTGSTSNHQRHRGQSAAYQRDPVAPQPIHYRLHYQPDDEKIARKVREAMKRYGHAENDAAHEHILLITRQTEPDWAAALARELPAMTPIIAEQVDFDQYSSIARYQVVDFRRRDPSVLTGLAQYFSNARGDDFSRNVTPISFAREVYPSVGARVDDLQRAAPGLFTAQAFNLMSIALVALLVVTSLIRDLSSPQLLRTPTPTPQPTLSVVEVIATQEAQFREIEASIFGSTTVAVAGLRFKLTGNWTQPPVHEALEEPFASMVGTQAALWAGVNDETWGQAEGELWLVALRYTGELSSENTPERLTTGDSRLTAQAFQRATVEVIGDKMGSVWLIVIEGGDAPVLIQAFVTGPAMMLSTLPPALKDMVSSMTRRDV